MEEKKDQFERHRIYPSMKFDPDNKFDSVFRTAEATFLRMIKIGHKLKFHAGFFSNADLGIKRVDCIDNQQLADTFQRQKEEFRRKSIPSDEILLFQDMDQKQAISILAENFDPNQNQYRSNYISMLINIFRVQPF